MIPEPIFFCDPNPRYLLSSFIDASEIPATQSNAQVKMNLFLIETAKESKLAGILETLKQRRSHCVGIEAEDNNSSKQFLKK